MLTIEKTAKTVEEALSEALRELNVDENQVDYEVLEEPSKGLFGFIGNKPAKIRVSVKKNSPIEIATKFLEDIFSAMNITVNIEKVECAEHILYKLFSATILYYLQNIYKKYIRLKYCLSYFFCNSLNNWYCYTISSLFVKTAIALFR